MRKKIFIYLILLIFIHLFYSCSSNEKNGTDSITDLINPLKLTSGHIDSILVSDLFYADNYSSIEFSENSSITIHYDSTSNIVVFKPENDYEGLTTVAFNFDGTDYDIPAYVKYVKPVKFSFDAKDKYDQVYLFGNFNGWNRASHPMSDEDQDGVFEISVPLEPGSYQYKFFAEGNEIIDPKNPEKAPNGLGDFNSIIIVPERHKNKSFLHINNFDSTDNEFKYSFIYERENQPAKLTYQNLVPFFNNHKISEDKISIDNKKITLSFDKNELIDNDVIRMAVTQKGQNTNLQTVRLFDGKPAGSPDDFTWNDAIIYSMMIDRFNDGDTSINNPIEKDSVFWQANYQGGDFQGIIDKLNDGYFDSLGVNTFWISPVYDNPDVAYQEYPQPRRWYSGYHGYWPIKPRGVEEKFGTMGKLKELVNTAHQHNIKVLLDFVSNHVHEESPYWKNHRDWFGQLELPDGRLNIRFWDEYRLTTWFEPFMPSFDFIGSKEALDQITDDAIWWLEETGADGFRHDAVKHVPNVFWRELTRKIKNEIHNKIPVYQIGETFGSYYLVNSYINNGQLSSQFNFLLYDVAIPTFISEDASFKRLDDEMKKSFSVFGYNHLMGNVIDSHDKPRFMALADGDLNLDNWYDKEIGWENPPEVDHPESYNIVQTNLAYTLTTPGIPVIYYGDEIGMTGAQDPDNRRMMKFSDDLKPLEIEMLNDVRNIVNIRKNHPALRYGDFYTLKADKNIYAYIRSDMNERILVVINKGSEQQNTKLKIPNYYNSKKLIDLVSDKEIVVNKNYVNINSPKHSWRIFKVE